MKERPILFSAPMVRAILAGNKTQTRRVVKPQPHKVDGGVPFGDAPAWAHAEPGSAVMPCTYGKRGDQLWVRETHAPQPDCLLAWDRWRSGLGGEKPIIHYAADALETSWVDRWRPSIHMPRWASRITLEVTGVRVERLQGISKNDAQAEGIERMEDFYDCPCWRVYGEPDGADVVAPDDPIGSYRSLWELIHGPGSWDTNPWVWVVEFRRIAQDAKDAGP